MLCAATIFVNSILIYIISMCQKNKTKFLTRYRFCIAMYCV